MLLLGNDGKHINVKTLVLDSGKMILASKFGQSMDDSFELELSAEEVKLQDTITVCSRNLIYFVVILVENI